MVGNLLMRHKRNQIRIIINDSHLRFTLHYTTRSGGCIGARFPDCGYFFIKSENYMCLSNRPQR